MTTSKISTSTPCIRENEPMTSTLEHLYTICSCVNGLWTLHMATYPTHKQSEDLLSDTRNLNQDSKQNQNFTMSYPLDHYTKSHKQACKITLHLPRMHPHQNSILQKPHSRTSQAQRSPAIACTQMHGQRNHSPRNANFARN